MSRLGFWACHARTGVNSLHLCRVNPVHVVADASHAMISAWFVPRLSPCMGPAWRRPSWASSMLARSRRVRRRLLMAPRLMDGNKICVVPEFLEEQQSMHKIWDKIFLSEDSVKVI